MPECWYHRCPDVQRVPQLAVSCPQVYIVQSSCGAAMQSLQSTLDYAVLEFAVTFKDSSSSNGFKCKILRT